MSSVVRVAAVAEGRTDRSVLNAAIAALVGARSYELRLLQPEDAAATAPFGALRPFGWAGVYRWCREVVERSGRLANDVTLQTYDIVILHLDADVAGCNYAEANIHDAPSPTDLPCAEPCPPCSTTTNALRLVLLNWAGESTTPPKTVLCTPAQETEAWVLAALYPSDPIVEGGNLECTASPSNLLGAKPLSERLVRGRHKQLDRYIAREPDITRAWPTVRQICSEAERVSVDFIAVIPP